MDVICQVHAPAALLPGERAPGTHWIDGWMGPIVDLDAVEKRKNPAFPGNPTPVAQPVA
jgi:hypothetical protein